MSDTSQGPGWWLASDGKWYPPADAAPAPGWWLASDGKWYPPTTDTVAGDTVAPAKAQTTVKAKPPIKAKPTAKAQPPAKTRPTAKAQPPAQGRPPAKAKPPAKTRPTARAQPPVKAKPPAKAQPAAQDRPLPPRPGGGLRPEEQVERRDNSSRQDAAMLAAARAEAAARALARMTVSETATRADDRVGESAANGVAEARERTGSTAPDKRAQVVPGPSATHQALLEVKPSVLGADIEHIGERLAIFPDRVELRDRNDRVRQRISGEEITDILVSRRLGGAVLTIECVDGPAIVAKGLRPEQAEEARDIIMRKTRRSGPVSRAGRPRSPGGRAAGSRGTTGRDAAPEGRSLSASEEADLLGKLADLRRAGVLSESEFEEMIERVARLVRGEALPSAQV